MPDANVLKTLADELLELVKKGRKISVEEAAKSLKVPLATVQALVDFLVEERVFGIEYKFTTPYIYLYKDEIKEARAKDKGVAERLMTKEQFYEISKEKKVPYEHIGGLWRRYLQQNLPKIKLEFFRKAREKNISEEDCEKLWKRYLAYL